MKPLEALMWLVEVVEWLYHETKSVEEIVVMPEWDAIIKAFPKTESRINALKKLTNPLEVMAEIVAIQRIINSGFIP